MATRSGVGSAARFLLVGGTTVLIDAAVYAALEVFGIQYAIAKTISFIVGAAFAYFANWRFTFGGRRGRWSELLFVAVYFCALGINVLLNGLVRGLRPDSALIAALAFLVATGASAVWNFVGMSLFVFERPGAAAVAPDLPTGGGRAAHAPDRASADADAPEAAAPPARQ